MPHGSLCPQVEQAKALQDDEEIERAKKRLEAMKKRAKNLNRDDESMPQRPDSEIVVPVPGSVSDSLKTADSGALGSERATNAGNFSRTLSCSESPCSRLFKVHMPIL